MRENIKIHIIGFGRLGKLLYKLLNNAGFRDINVITKDDDLPSESEFLIICTPDSVIKKVSNQLANSIRIVDGMMAVHCSGILGSDALKALKDKGVLTACLHPMQSVTSETVSLEHTYFDLEGDEAAIIQLEELVKHFGADSFRVTAEEKELLHVSAVIASNYLVTLADLALRISETSAIPQKDLLSAILPLMNSSLQNLEKLSTSEALTGPIARGDVHTVQRHIILLQDKPDLLEIYKKLGLLTLELIRSEITDHSVKFRLYDLLK